MARFDFSSRQVRIHTPVSPKSAEGREHVTIADDGMMEFIFFRLREKLWIRLEPGANVGCKHNGGLDRCKCRY